MKFVPLFDEVTSVLNFSTLDCRVIGGCDLYTTKAAGSDKKLYRNIEYSLESQYVSLLKYSASIASPSEGLSPKTLSQPSPFGPLSQISSRRTFAYLIAILNASHSDYDFSEILSPTDFRRERSLKSVINVIDSNLNGLRPVASVNHQNLTQGGFSATSSSPSHSRKWGPDMWAIIDKEMVLEDCTVYCWAPPDELFDGDERSIWSMNYFFFNKELKRVTYLHVRAIPAMTHSPRECVEMFKQTANTHQSGANKRARFWLGDQADNVIYEQQAELDAEDEVS
ncbi:Repressor of RNA polymerase III transcription maf1 [Erysiphe neolycopersici]|uniref:Repressor of RNA polymerase III transcription MAF1 n=1 Tax=Erysiphe neolycopersici TaxID=212602 RepID=A0A420HVP9_9PEZI|nr:Repressor of RNA polymerase III transcription maf1 [Erysiphe neolycopersici]